MFWAPWSAPGFIQGESAELASAGLGAALVVYAALGVSAVRVRVARPAEPWLGPLVGLSTGLVTGITGVFVIPAVPYLAGLGLSKDELIQALGLSFTVSTFAVALALMGGGSFEGGVAAASLSALAPAPAGMALGSWLRRRISGAVFRHCFFLGLLALGLHLGTQILV